MGKGKGGRVAIDRPQIYGATEMQELQIEQVDDGLQLQVHASAQRSYQNSPSVVTCKPSPAWELRADKGNFSTGEHGANVAG